jgi:hypothetical protein
MLCRGAHLPRHAREASVEALERVLELLHAFEQREHQRNARCVELEVVA